MYTLGTHGCETPAKRLASMRANLSRQKAIRRGQAGENPALDDQIARLQKQVDALSPKKEKAAAPAKPKAAKKPKSKAKKKKAKKRKKST